MKLKKKDIPAHSPTTKTTYDNWDALVAAESNGFVAVAIMVSKNSVWPWMVGPFETEAEANKRAAKMRRQAKKEAHSELTVTVRVRPIWKPDR